MKKTTLAAQTGTGIVVLALMSAMAQADSMRYSEIAQIELDMENAAMAATKSVTGEIIEIELEMEDAKSVWEVDIVNQTNQVVTVEIDGQTGEILSTTTDDDLAMPLVNAVNLSQAVNIVKAVEQGVIVEAELEHDDGLLIWEVETIGASNEETKFRVDANTGEVLI